MLENKTTDSEALRKAAVDPELMLWGRRALEMKLRQYRTLDIVEEDVMAGMVITDLTDTNYRPIRMTLENGVRIALLAMADKLEEQNK